MQTFQTVILILHLLVAVGLVGLVLLQRSEGGALGVGGGGGGGLISGRGAADALVRGTTILGGIFFLTSLSLTLLADAMNESGRSAVDERAPIERRVDPEDAAVPPPPPVRAGPLATPAAEPPPGATVAPSPSAAAERAAPAAPTTAANPEQPALRTAPGGGATVPAPSPPPASAPPAESPQANPAAPSASERAGPDE